MFIDFYSINTTTVADLELSCDTANELGRGGHSQFSPGNVSYTDRFSPWEERIDAL